MGEYYKSRQNDGGKVEQIGYDERRKSLKVENKSVEESFEKRIK